MQAVAELARVLTGAEGVALALRTNGLMLCRARSGDPAPALGSRLNTDSGISGECLRAGSVLICNDTANDPRVDPQVCRALGIRSLAVAPVCTSTGVGGILEGFSTRTQAFGEEAVNALRGLAEIAQAAYERESHTEQPPVSAALMRRSAELNLPAKTETRAKAETNESAIHVYAKPFTARKFWILGIAVMGLLAFVGVWLSRPEPVVETATKEPSPEKTAATAHTSMLVRATPPLPSKSNRRIEHDGETSRPPLNRPPLNNAAEIRPEVSGSLKESTENPSATRPGKNTNAEIAPAENPPLIIIEPSDSGRVLASLGNAPDVVPTLGTPVSQGVTTGQLIRKVEPAYPPLALTQGIAGSVALEVTIAEDGTIREVKRITGPSLLATAASDAIRQWRYTPFLLNGKPVEFHEQVTVVFKLP